MEHARVWERDGNYDFLRPDRLETQVCFDVPGAVGCRNKMGYCVPKEEVYDLFCTCETPLDYARACVEHAETKIYCGDLKDLRNLVAVLETRLLPDLLGKTQHDIERVDAKITELTQQREMLAGALERLSAPDTVVMRCPEHGASIGYTEDGLCYCHNCGEEGDAITQALAAEITPTA